MKLLRVVVVCFFACGQCSAELLARRYLRNIAHGDRFHAVVSASDLSTPKAAECQAGSSMPHDDHFHAVVSASVSNPKAMMPNDLWAIRDLLLVGYTGVFLTPASGGRQEVRRAAVDLAEMLPKLHPHPPCRQQISAALQGTGQERAKIKAAAAASWSCLPAKYSAQSFDDPFPEDALDEDDEETLNDKAFQARNPYANKQMTLGACRWSTWPRTCSYWVSLHSMACLADKLQLSAKFMQAVVPLFAGGAILCGGCTKHFNFMHSPVLSQEILKGQGNYL